MTYLYVVQRKIHYYSDICLISRSLTYVRFGHNDIHIHIRPEHNFCNFELHQNEGQGFNEAKFV